MFISFNRVGCTTEKLEELQELCSNNPFMTYCTGLHFWAMEHKEDLLYYEEPYILESNMPIGPGVSQAIKIKRPGKYAFSVDSESKAKKLQSEALEVLRVNNKKVKSGTGKMSLNSKVLPASGVVKLSVKPAYKVVKEPIGFVKDVFEEELSRMKQRIENTSSKNYAMELEEELLAIYKKQKKVSARIEKNRLETVRVATRCGEQYRFSYYDPFEEKRKQVGFGDVIIFYNDPNKPFFSFSEASKKRTDTRENSPGFLYSAIYEDMEICITI